LRRLPSSVPPGCFGFAPSEPLPFLRFPSVGYDLQSWCSAGARNFERTNPCRQPKSSKSRTTPSRAGQPTGLEVRPTRWWREPDSNIRYRGRRRRSGCLGVSITSTFLSRESGRGAMRRLTCRAIRPRGDCR
jgi:hypothetical protein